MKQPALRKQWFLSQKKSYYPLRQKRSDYLDMRRAFNDAGEYEEHSSTNVGECELASYAWLTLDGWILREIVFGKCGDGPASEQREIAIKSFHDHCQMKDYPKRKTKVGGTEAWVLGVYKGSETQIGDVEHRGPNLKHRKTAVDFDNARDLQNTGKASMQDWLSEHKSVIGDHMEQTVTEADLDGAAVPKPAERRFSHRSAQRGFE